VIGLFKIKLLTTA